MNIVDLSCLAVNADDFINLPKEALECCMSGQSAVLEKCVFY